MKQDSGVILVNVLLVLAIGSAITVLMFTSQDQLLNRSARSAAAAQAQALALGAETSVRVALQRDMTDAPDTDHFAEPWAQSAQQTVTLATGTFAIEIDDVQGRYNLNNLTTPGIVQPQILLRLTRSLDLADPIADAIIRHVQERGPITQIEQITGLSESAVRILRPYVTALPDITEVNINTADTLVLAAVLNNAGAARQLVRLRDRQGFLTRDDLLSAGILAATGAGFTSQIFDIQTQAQVDDVTVHLRSRIWRQSELTGKQALVISRTFGPN